MSITIQPVTNGDIISKRTANSKHFDLGNGKYRAEIYSIPVHYKDNYTDKTELWKDIDLTWQNGKITKALYYAKLNGLTLTVTDKQTGKVAIIALEKVGKTSVNTESTFTFIGNKATIKDFALDTDLEIEATPETVKYTRVLKSDKATLDAQFDIKGDWEVGYSAEDADRIPLTVTKSLTAGKTTETIQTKDLQYTDFMGETKTAQYPIRIDPSPVTIQPSSKDTYIRENAATTNYGSSTSLELYTYPIYWRRILIDFDVSSVAGFDLTSSSMQLYYYLGTLATGIYVTAYRCRRIGADAWVEAQATWNIYKTGSNWGTTGAGSTSTDIDISITASSPVPGSYGWMSWDVLSASDDAIANRGNVLSLRLHFASDAVAATAAFYSKEYSTDTTLCPKLVVEYTVSGWANIAKVNGVAVAAFAKMNGVAVASIAKVNGVAV